MTLEAEDTVLRYSPSKKRKKEIKSHSVVKDYNYHFNGVDHKDRDTADWSVSMKSNKFFFGIFYWNFDGVVHCAYNVVKDVVEVAKSTVDSAVDYWIRYTEPNLGRYHFQMDAGIALINKGLSLDWKDPSDPNTKPKYCRSIDWVPCDCPEDDSKQIRFFFCRNCLTHGTAHKDVSKKMATSSKARKACSDRVDLGKTAAYCYYCIEDVKAENPGIKFAAAKKLAVAKAKGTNNKPSTRKGCKTYNKHVCERHWDDHGKNN